MLRKLNAVFISGAVAAACCAAAWADAGSVPRPLKTKTASSARIQKAPAEAADRCSDRQPVDPTMPRDPEAAPKKACPFRRKTANGPYGLPEDRFKAFMKNSSGEDSKDAETPASAPSGNPEAAAAKAGKLFDAAAERPASAPSAAGTGAPALSRPKAAKKPAPKECARISLAPAKRAKKPAAAKPVLKDPFEEALSAVKRALGGGAASPAKLSEQLTLAALAPRSIKDARRAPAGGPSCESCGFKKATWGLEVFTGDAYNFPVPLSVQQAGYPDIHQTANYDTRPFDLHAPYYAWRVSRWEGSSGWEFEHIHTKLALANPVPEIQRFSVSHGYNYALINRAFKVGHGIILRAGGGVIVTHPESQIRGRELDSENGGNLGGGYSVSGVGAQVSATKRFYLAPSLFTEVEGKLTGGYANVPVSGGSANVPALSLHGLIGIGAEF